MVPSVPHGVLPRLRGFLKVEDLHVFPDRVALAPVKGADPESLGALIGFVVLCGLLGAILGNAVGRIIGKNKVATRLARTATLGPDQLAAEGAVVVPQTSITSAVARHHGSGGRLRLQLADGTTRKFSWSNAYTKDLDVDRVLHGIAPGRTVVHPVSTARKVARWVGIAFLVLCAVGIVAGVVVSIVSPTPKSVSSVTATGLPDEVAVPLRRACTAWSALGSETDPSVERIKATIATARPDLEQAAAADASFRQAADSIAFLDAYFAAPTAEAQPRVEAAAGDVDAACARA
jgi:hypothetical protein